MTELEHALSAARAAVGTPEQVARLRARVAAGLAAGPGAGAPARSGHLKLIGGSLAGMLAVGGALLLGAPRQSVAPRPADAPIAALPPAAPVLVVEQMPPTAAVAASAPERMARAPRAHKRSEPPPTAAQPSELELVTQAQTALERQPAAALEWLESHERLYPRGMLGEERDVLRVDAEWALGRRSAALTHARQFVARYPGSAQTRRLNRLLADHKDPAQATPTE